MSYLSQEDLQNLLNEEIEERKGRPKRNYTTADELVLIDIKEVLGQYLKSEPILYRDRAGNLLIKVDCLKNLFVPISALREKTI